jgi:flagellar hook-associated protein 1 FlgK
MSISSALGNALSGLTVSSRSADVVSSNIANAMTEGYGVRSLDIGSRIGARDGSGAQVLGVLRDRDPVLTGQRRGADATLAWANTEADHLRALEP